MEILGDWGTSRLRLFLCNGREVLDRVEASGIAAAHATLLPTLRASIHGWIAAHGRLPLTLCGMVGSRNGLSEVPYVACPVDSTRWAASALALGLDDLDVRIAAGLSCIGPLGTADVMRGEETQIFGALSLSDTLRVGRHLIVLPGTHSKWALLENGVIDTFQTFPTGELFAVLRDHSTLTRADRTDSGSDLGFQSGLNRSQGDSALLAQLFEVRTSQLIDQRSRGWAVGLLSGLLIGHEAREGLRLMPDFSRVTLIGDPSLLSLYGQAFAALGIEALELDGDRCSISGLLHLARGQATH